MKKQRALARPLPVLMYGCVYILISVTAAFPDTPSVSDHSNAATADVVIEKNHEAIASRLFESLRADSSYYPPLPGGHDVLNLSSHSYYFEEEYPGFCGIGSKRKRRNFLHNANVTRFSKGGFLRYVERQCNSRIYYLKEADLIYIVHHASRSPSKRDKFSEDLLYDQINGPFESEKFVSLVNELALRISRSRQGGSPK
ncbi:hypothetical protein [Roseibium salinum]|uniref:Uncharacterized protein n=1 Tax=Roseibium salinum TaxID=1604349 RepID=A0ABT3R369_9HYPH|nr:hypothetical protein [Roseibium sp. DSM 29163]MCX2723658.1 hypothetical protein [Roseibium sp. DSM 29163]